MKRLTLVAASLAVVSLAVACGSSGGGTGGQTSSATTTSHGGAGGAGGGFVSGTVLCSPFTASNCDVAKGEACDFDGANFRCFAGPNDGKLCGACGDPGDGGAADYCAVGLTCLASGECAAFCCDDGDCGPGGTCDKMFLEAPEVGVCVTAASGTGGTGGTGGGDGLTHAACSAPATPPSMGACYKP